MTSVAKIEPGSQEVATMEGGLLSVIARAASDPAVDIDKLERLLAMQERVMERNAKTEFTAAKIAMRPDLPEITMKGHIVIKDKNTGAITQDTPFARFEDIHEAVMPVLTRHGFDLAFKNGMAPDGKVRVTTILSHVGGHSEDTYFDLPHDSSGSKNAVQAVGSSTSYAKRYGVLSILNIKVVGEDDNANASEAAIEKVTDAPFPQGPAKNKTELKALGRALWGDVEQCDDGDMLEALLIHNAALLSQLERAMPSWINGGRDAKGETYEGLRAVIDRKRSDIQFTR
jgi:hypothetical protein